MGTPDTIHLDNPIKCKFCGEEINSIQTHELYNLMQNYHIGEYVKSNILSGIIKETVYCPNKKCKRKEKATQFVYITIWHNIVIGVYEKQSEAESAIQSVDIINLVEFIVAEQRRKKVWENKYNHIRALLSNYVNYIDTKKVSPLSLHSENIEKIANSKHPLKELLKIVKEFKPDDSFSYFTGI